MPATPKPTNRLREAAHKLYRLMISAVLEKHAWNKKATAEELGISRDDLNYYMRKLGITPGSADILAQQMRHASDPAHKVRPNQYEGKPPQPAAKAAAAHKLG